MRIRVLSDLHLDFAPLTPGDLGEDVVVLAGDIGEGTRGLRWALAHWTTTPVVYVLGNHEFYRHAYPRLTEKLRGATQGTNVHVLENEGVTIDGYRFLGCTLWTDFRLLTDPVYAGYICSREMNDFRAIRLSPEYRRFRTLDAATVHARSRGWLTEHLGRLPRDRTVVVTHHAPHEQSVPRHRRGQIVSSAYASDLTGVLAEGPALWLHGHVHTAVDYTEGATRVVANPRGYPGEQTGFDQGLVLELP